MNNEISCSVIISTYNWPEALKLCIVSILKQTLLPNEILIADDGSNEETLIVIRQLQEISPIEIKHIWHEDKGFRLSAIRNKAIADSSSEYIIQIDGDIILHSKFIADHLEIAQNGYFVSGKRAHINRKESQKLLLAEGRSVNFWSLRKKIQAIRLPDIFNFRRYYSSKNPLRGVKGSNMAFWKKDLILVNGYNEDLEMWGYEDKEISARLINAGIYKKRVRYKCISYHLYHEEASRSNLSAHLKMLQDVIRSKSTSCMNGINKYKNVTTIV